MSIFYNYICAPVKVTGSSGDVFNQTPRIYLYNVVGNAKQTRTKKG